MVVVVELKHSFVAAHGVVPSAALAVIVGDL